MEIKNDWTTLIVVGYRKSQHPKHNQYILEKVEKAKAAQGTTRCTPAKNI